MRKIILIPVFLFISMFLVAQITTPGNITVEKKDNDAYHDYSLLKNFLSMQKNNPGMFTTQTESGWNSKLYQQQFIHWYTTSRKKELAAVILIDSKSVIQTMPAGYDVKDLKWISPAKRYSYRDSYQYKNLSFGEQVATDIIYNVASGLLSKKKYRYRYSAAENNKTNSTPSFLKF